MASDQGALLLRKQLKGKFKVPWKSIQSYTLSVSLELLKNPVDGFSAGLVDEQNIYEWDILIIGPTDTP